MVTKKKKSQKISTGHYILEIRRVIDVDVNSKDLHVTVQVKDNLQESRAIAGVDDAWNEKFPIRVPMAKTEVVITLYCKSRWFFGDHSLGTNKMAISDLVKLCSGKGASNLMLSKSDGALTPKLVIDLKSSDVQKNATVALNNMFSHPNGGEISQTAGAVNVNLLLEEGRNEMRNDFAQVVSAVAPQIDGFVDFVDGIVRSHPLLNAGWQLVIALYKVTSEQIKTDKRINSLLRSSVSVFDFIQDVSELVGKDKRLASLQRSITKLLEEVIGCSLFIRDYMRHSSLRRTWDQASNNSKMNDIETALQILRKELLEAVHLQTALFAKDQAKVAKRESTDKSFEETLKRIRDEFDLTPIMLEEMESSSHRECMDTTRTEWLNKIVKWAQSDTKKVIYWLYGIPGCGKSTVAHSIIQHPKIQPLLVSHIIFKRENTRRHDILKLVVYRLAVSNAKLATEIAAALHKPRLTVLDTFRNLILTPLKKVKLDKPLVVVLDALDEYGTSESRVPFLQLLRAEFAKLPIKVRFFITSRPEADLVNALSGQAHVTANELRHKSNESRRDVGIYLRRELRELVPATVTSDELAWEEKMIVFTSAADGLFIWAKMAIEVVRRSKRPYKKICSLADNDEAGLTLDGLYVKALEAVDLDWNDDDTRELFAKLFALILPNRGTITIELLDRFFGYEGDSSETLLFALQSFVSYSGTKLRPVEIHHKTFADFLQSALRLPKEPWYIDMVRENIFIVERCFTVLEELHFNLGGSVTGNGKEAIASDIAPHLLYAVLYWADHLRQCPFSPETLKCLRKFLSEKLLFWFEVLSHLKEFSRVASKALLYAMDWVSWHSADTTSILMDANLIVSNFSNTIARSPKLIYMTALPLTARSNALSAQYIKLISKQQRIGKFNESKFDVKEVQAKKIAKPFRGHRNAINSVIFSPDMRHVISGGNDCTIRTWNARNGEATTPPVQGHKGIVRSVAVSPEGKTLASASEDASTRLWDAECGSSICNPLKGHLSPVYTVAFSPTDRRITTGSLDGTIRIWNVDTGKAEGKPLTGHKGGILCVTYSPGGRRLASGSTDTTIRIWSTETGAMTGEPIIGHAGSVHSVVFTSDGRRIVSGSNDCTIRVWDSAKGAQVGLPFQGHAGAVNAVAVSPDGRRAASASSDHSVRIWNLESQKTIGEPLRGHKSIVQSIAYSRDGSRIVSSDRTAGIIVWDGKMGKPIVGTDVERPGPSREGKGDFNRDDYHYFERWKFQGGWIIGSTGKHRLWLPKALRKLVKPRADRGLYIHRQLNFRDCNGNAIEHKGFIMLN